MPTVTLNGIIGESSIWDIEDMISLEDVKSQVGDDPSGDIVVLIDSPGGDVYEGFAIVDYLESLPNRVVTIVEGKAFSIASVIFLAGETREMRPNATLMVHNPFLSIWGDYDADSLEDLAAKMRREEQRIIDFYESRTNLSEDDVREYMKTETYLSATESLDLGFATEVSEPLRAVALFKPAELSNKTKNRNNMASDNSQNQHDQLLNEMTRILRGLTSTTDAPEATDTVDDPEKDTDTPDVQQLRERLDEAEERAQELETERNELRERLSEQSTAIEALTERVEAISRLRIAASGEERRVDPNAEEEPRPDSPTSKYPKDLANRFRRDRGL